MQPDDRHMDGVENHWAADERIVLAHVFRDRRIEAPRLGHRIKIPRNAKLTNISGTLAARNSNIPFADEAVGVGLAELEG